MNHITVRVGKLPGRIGEYVLNGDRTVATALATANLDPTGYELRVQGQPATPATILSEGDLVLLVKKIKGNAMGCIEAYVGRVPGPALVLVAFVEATVLAALEAAGIDVALDDVVFVNDVQATLASHVEDNDEVVVKKAAVAKAAPAMIIAAEQAAPSAARVAEVERVVFPAIEVGGTDAAALRAEAQALREEALGLQESAGRALIEAAEHEARAAGCDARAQAIEQALAEFNSAKSGLESLGIPVPKDGESKLTAGLSRVPRTTLVAIARRMGLEVAPTATKAQLVSAIVAAE